MARTKPGIRRLAHQAGNDEYTQQAAQLPTRPPAGLGDHGRQFWRKYAKLANALGVAQSIDTAAFLNCAQHYELAMLAWDEIRREGLFRKDENGVTRRHPAAQVHRDSWAAVLKALKEFGMTPYSREAITTAPPDEPSIEDILTRDR